MRTVGIDSIAALFAAGEGKHEWVQGRVERMEPTSHDHDQTEGFLVKVVGTYAEEHDAGMVAGDGFAERLDEETIRVPDLAFFKKSSLGKIRPTHSEGGADLVIEIVSPESRLRDRGEKYYEYEKAGIEEYWIVDPERKRAEFYRLREGAYEPVVPDSEGKVHSSALPGFFLRVEWLWNRPKVLDALRELGVL